MIAGESDAENSGALLAEAESVWLFASTGEYLASQALEKLPGNTLLLRIGLPPQVWMRVFKPVLTAEFRIVELSGLRYANIRRESANLEEVLTEVGWVSIHQYSQSSDRSVEK